MCAAVVEHVAVDEEVRAERRRILVTLLDGLDERRRARGGRAARRDPGLPRRRRALRRRPARPGPPALPRQARRRCSRTAWSRAATSPSSARRRRGAPAPASRSRTTSTPSASASRPSGRRSSSARGRPRSVTAAALTLAGPLMRYCDFASTHAAHAYVEYQQYMVADADRERRDLLEHLLAGEMPDARTAAGRRPGPRHRRGLADARRRRRHRWTRARTPTRRTSAARPSPAPGCTTPRRSSSCARPRSWPSSCSAPTPTRAGSATGVDALQRRLRSEGIALAMGVSTVAAGVAELPRAYQEAHVALPGVGADGGVAALARLTPFDYLALQRRRHRAAPRRPAPARLPRRGPPRAAGS